MIWIKILTRDTISQKRPFVKGIASREPNITILECSSPISLLPLRPVLRHLLILQTLSVVHLSAMVFHKYFALAYSDV